MIPAQVGVGVWVHGQGRALPLPRVQQQVRRALAGLVVPAQGGARLGCAFNGPGSVQQTEYWDEA